MPWEAAVELALIMVRVARDHHPDIRILSTDPITGIGERQFQATDRLVAAGVVDFVGVNYYPHTARTSLLKVLLKTWKRYGKPILVSETSWHDGHPIHHRRHPGYSKGDWFRYMTAEIALARAQGVEVAGLCWYPVVDCPPWQRPRSRNRWSHGLIRKDAGVDPSLADALRESLMAPSAAAA
jgi:beta-glucosidase/6-phospho-beta-glucosidase/beta-galactosidase